jgi:hypothetical protein
MPDPMTRLRAETIFNYISFVSSVENAAAPIDTAVRHA